MKWSEKMKVKKIVILLIASVLVSCASLDRIDPEPFVYVYEMSRKWSQDEIFKKARLWIAETYVSFKDVITFDDQNAGVIKGSGRGEVYLEGGWFEYSSDYKYSYQISIYCKDEKTKIEFSIIERGSMKRVVYDAIKVEFDALAENYFWSFFQQLGDW